MSWSMPTAGPWNPSVVPTADMNMGNYTPEQWAVVQQQNWQQWAQWQQQYAQWQSQYGEKYAQQMQSMQSLGSMPPLPPAGAPPPAPPPPDQPPPPPHENNQPLFGSTTTQPTPVPAPAAAAPNQRSGYNNANFAGKNQNWSYDAPPPPDSGQIVNADALKKLAEEERLFDIQFQKWEEEIKKWKDDNVNHPDKEAYKEYEAKFEACRMQLLERRQQMNQKRAKLLGQPPAAGMSTLTTGNNNTPTTVPPPTQTIKQSYPNKPQSQTYNAPLPAGNYQNKNNQQKEQYNAPGSNYNRSNNKTIDPQDRYESYNNIEDYSDSANNLDKATFLPASGSGKGIPGLDLVPETDKQHNQDVIDITDDGNQRLQPDYSKISKGINNILGDEKIMNILSMVRVQNFPQDFSHGQNSPMQGHGGPSGSVGPPGPPNTGGPYNSNMNNQNVPPNNQWNRNDNQYNNQQYDNRQNMPFNRQGPSHMDQNHGPNRGIDQNQGPNRGYDQNQGPNRSYDQNQGPNRGYDQNQGPNRVYDQNQGDMGQNQYNDRNSQYGGPNDRNSQFGGPNDRNSQFGGPDDRNTQFGGPNDRNAQYGGPNMGSGPRGQPFGKNNMPPRPLLDLPQNINNRGMQGNMHDNRGMNNSGMYDRGMDNSGMDDRGMQENTFNLPPMNQPPPMTQPPPPKKWVEEPLFTPSIIVDYEHTALRLKARDFIEPVHTFDYDHISKDEDKKKDFESEVDQLFTRKTRRPENDSYMHERNRPERFDRESPHVFERRPRQEPPRDSYRARVPPREEYEDRRRPESGYFDRRPDDRRADDRRIDDRRIDDRRSDDRRSDDRDKYTRREDSFRDRERDRYRDSRRDERRRSSSRDRESRKRGRSKDSEISDHSKKSREIEHKVIEDPMHVVMIDDILEPPGRDMRPEKIVIILRGPPGSGKSYLAKLIRDREAEYGGAARIMSIDDYFMQEADVEERDPATGKIVKKPTLKYEYDERQEEAYINSLKRAFKRSLTDGYFSFLIMDAVNDQLKSYADIWNFARQSGFQVYICTMELDPQVCHKRNIHNRKLDDIEVICARFFKTPSHHIQLDATTLLQNAAITEVHMEDASDDVIIQEDDDVIEVETSFTSKWEKMDNADKLARLDGTSKPLRPSQLSMEDYLQLDDWKPTRAKPGKKTVRWADIEERREQEKMRAIGFVVGQTDWNRMTDPTMGSSALTQTKYIERVRRTKDFS